MLTLNDSSNIIDLVQKYKNKQRLAGGYANPNMVGSIIQGGLEAMYNTQGAREDRALRNDLAQKNYDLSLKDYGLRESAAALNRENFELSKTNSDRNYRLNERQLDSADNSAILSMAGNMLPLSLATYKIGQESGWWGTPKKDVTKTPDISSGLTLSDYTSPVTYSAPENLSNIGFDFTTQSNPIYAGQGDTGLELATSSQDNSWLDNTWELIKNFLF